MSRPIKHLRLSLSLVLWAFVIFFFWPRAAYAWGPAVHAKLALDALASIGLLSPALRKLLKRYPNDFIYGNLSADIILGKAFVDYYFHCHNWRVAFEVLNSAKTDSQKAFAYGYLCHLAADVVAHNLFIPDKMVRTYQTLAARHAYWEIRFDLLQDPVLYERAHTIAQHYHVKNDALLETVLHETLFSFQTNKRIFNGLLLLQKHRQFQKLFSRATARSKLGLHEDRVRLYETLTKQAVLEFLQNLDEAPVMRADPAGLIKLDLAKDVRKTLKTLHRKNEMKEREVKSVIGRFHEILTETLYAPEECPPAGEIIQLAMK